MKLGKFSLRNKRYIWWLALALLALSALYLYRLGSLVGHLSSNELAVVAQPIGWHGLYRQPFNIGLQLLRSVIFYSDPTHGQTLTRLANVPFGIASIIIMYSICRWWYGARIALMTSLLFAASAWTLHVSRIASFDVLYLIALPALLLANTILRKHFQQPLLYLGALLIWLLELYTPGLVWFVFGSVVLQRRYLLAGWRQMSNRWRGGVILTILVCLPLLLIDLLRPGVARLWLGLPAHFLPLKTLAKHFAGVFVHAFVRGPQYPELWLGKAPVLDVFSLAVCVIGIYYLARHFTAFRSRLLAAYFLLGAALISFGGMVSFSLVVPLLYVATATGLAYLIQSWQRTFPLNPLARGVGITLLSLAIALSCLYNLRAYFIAWPHNAVTRATFIYRR